MRGWAAMVGVLASAACGGSDDGGSLSVTGAIGGLPFGSGDAQSWQATGASSTTTTIAMVNLAPICTSLIAGDVFANSNVILLTLTGPTAPAAGSYTVGTPSAITQVAGVYARYDATCSPAAVEGLVSGGTLVITQASASAVGGTFDLTFGADHVTGSFLAPTCAASGFTALSTGILPDAGPAAHCH